MQKEETTMTINPSWGDSYKQEKQEKFDLFKTSISLFKEVAKQLGDNWQLKDEKWGEGYSHLSITDGYLDIWVSIEKWGNKGKYSLSGNYPRHGDGSIVHFYNSDPHQPGINVSIKKTAKQICSDITRRLLDDLKVTTDYVNERIKSSSVFADKQSSLVEQFTVMGWESKEKGNASIYKYEKVSADISFGSDCFYKLEINTCSMATLLKIGKLLTNEAK